MSITLHYEKTIHNGVIEHFWLEKLNNPVDFVEISSLGFEKCTFDKSAAKEVELIFLFNNKFGKQVFHYNFF